MSCGETRRERRNFLYRFHPDDFRVRSRFGPYFVVDGSFMPTSGAAAPTLTILAASFRAAEHILERARRGDFGPG